MPQLIVMMAVAMGTMAPMQGIISHNKYKLVNMHLFKTNYF